MRYSDKYLNEANPEDIRNIIRQQGNDIDSLQQAILRIQRLSGIANELGEIDYRAVDQDGNLRMVMSGIDLFDELGVNANFAGLNATGDVTIYLDADDGRFVFGSGDGWADEWGMFFANQEGLLAFLDTNDFDTMVLYADGSNNLVLENSFGDKSIAMFLDDASHNVRLINFHYSGMDLAAAGMVYEINGVQAFPILNGSSVLGSAFSITGTAGTYQDTGLSVTLPSAGTYKISVDARVGLTGNAGTLWWISLKLFNSTDSADVTNSERLAVLTAVTGQHFQMTCPIDIIVTVAASKTIKLYAARNGSGTPSWTVSTVESNSAGRTKISYEKIG